LELVGGWGKHHHKRYAGLRVEPKAAFAMRHKGLFKAGHCRQASRPPKSTRPSTRASTGLSKVFKGLTFEESQRALDSLGKPRFSV